MKSSGVNLSQLKLLSKRLGTSSKKFSDGGRTHYPVSLTIQGPKTELDKIASVKYELHRSFKRPIRFGTNRSADFEVRIWTWGFFDVRVSLFGIDGEEYNMIDRIEFD